MPGYKQPSNTEGSSSSEENSNNLSLYDQVIEALKNKDIRKLWELNKGAAEAIEERQSLKSLPRSQKTKEVSKKIKSLKKVIKTERKKFNHLDKEGRNALHFLMTEVQCDQAMHRELCSLLIHVGVDVNVRDVSGRTPIDYAILNDDAELIEILYEAEEKLNITGELLTEELLDKECVKSLNYLLVKNVNLEILWKLTVNVKEAKKKIKKLECSPKTVRVDSKITKLRKEIRVICGTLSLCDEQGLCAISQALIQVAEDINRTSHKGRTLIDYAALKDNIELMKLLHKAGATINKDEKFIIKLQKKGCLEALNYLKSQMQIDEVAVGTALVGTTALKLKWDCKSPQTNYGCI